MTRVGLGIGSNLGDRRANLALAEDALRRTPGIANLSVSRPRETPPVGGPAGQAPFLNAAAVCETELEPEPLLDRLQAVERQAGRPRDRPVRWAERTLDLDLLLYGNRLITSDRLTVPHPLMAVRRFVLAPLAEVAPDAVHPGLGRTVTELLANLDRRPGVVRLDGFPPAFRTEIRDALDDLAGQGWQFVESGTIPPTFAVLAGVRPAPPGVPTWAVAGQSPADVIALIRTCCRASRSG